MVDHSLSFRILVVMVALLVAGPSAATGSEVWTFERAIRFAVTNGPDARIAVSRIVAADAALRQANATYWPALQLESSYGYSDNPMRAFGSILNERQFDPTLDFNDVPGTDHLNVRGGLRVPLYSGGRNPAARDAARSGLAAARLGAEAVRQALSFEVARAFHTVQKARAFVRAAEAGAGAFATNATVARRRFEAGTLLKSDLLDLEVRWAQAREDLVRARNALSLSTRALRNLLGIEDAEFEVAEPAPEIPPPDADRVTGRAELLAATEREEAAEASVRQARAGYLPRLSAFAAADYDHGWRFNGGGDSYTAGAVVQWDVWDGQLTRGRVSEARAGLDAAREETRKLRLAIDLEAERARLAFEESCQRLEVTESVVAQAAESVELTRSRFEQGLALSSQLIDAESTLITARVRRAEAEADRRIAVAALRKALAQPQISDVPESIENPTNR